MSVENNTLTDEPEAPALILTPAGAEPARRPKPKLRKLRFLLVMVAFLLIAGISAVFGLLTSVASDLPQLHNVVQFRSTVDSELYDDQGHLIGVLAPPNKQVVDRWTQISQNMVHAIVSVEDRRFWTDPGVDLKGLARAFVSDVTGGQREGGSTIAEEFIKNVEQEEDHRTVFEKLREAGMAFQLVHRWKRTQIMTQYLNTIYFGNGGYGIESAARVYFGQELGYDPSDPGAGRCGDPTVQNPHRPECAQLLQPYQAALLAGMVANPTEFDPILHSVNAETRRNTVLKDMWQQRYITRAQYERAITRPLPTAAAIQAPQEPASAPYYTAWVRPQIIDALEREGVPAVRAAYEAYYGGLKIKLSLDLKLQQAAQQTIDDILPADADGPTASLVAIDNQTGEVKAMVSGTNSYQQDPFNLAVYGYRQPGSAFKLFTLAQALSSGAYGPGSIVDSAPQDIPYKLPNGRIAHFPVHNDEDSYLGPISLNEATAESDNAVFAQVGMHIGTKSIAKMAKAMGIRSPISTNPAMIIGGLRTGVSALDMAHAYETVATGGEKVYNKILGDVNDGPIGIHSITGCTECAQQNLVNHPAEQRILSPEVAAEIKEMFEGVVSDGTGTSAAIPGVTVAGKTGTTSNYVDAWFVGFTPTMTVAVWVGYPNSGKPMTTSYNGQPVYGGTFPAIIWKDFMEQALSIAADQSGSGSASDAGTTTSPLLDTGSASSDGTTTPDTTGATGAATGGGGTADGTGAAGNAGTAGTANNGAAAGAGTAGAAAGDTAGGSPSVNTTPAAAPSTGVAAAGSPASGTAGAPSSSSGSAGSSSGGTATTGGTGLGGG
jgi:penicillin-binding protein 1A